MSEAEEYWNEVYEKTPFASGREPSKFLVEMLHRLQKGKVLDIGMGEGVNAVYLAKKGFKVKGFDISSVAIGHAKAHAKEAGVEIEANRADLDLFLMGIMEYDTVIMTHFKPNIGRYYSEMIRALKQGGTLLVDSLMIEEIEVLLSKDEAYRNFYFTHNELLHHLKGLRILFYQESRVDGKNRIQCLAQKPLDKDAVKYKLFDMHAKEADTGPSHHRKLAESFFKKGDGE